MTRFFHERIVLIIDDVDRLTPAEIREVVRLVKVVADLPGAEPQIEDGGAYLEKTVQAAFTIAPARRERVLTLALDCPQEALGELPLTGWNRGVWSALVEDGVPTYLTTLRTRGRPS